MKNLIGITLMSLFLTAGFFEATVESWDPETGTGTLGSGGYSQ